MGCSRRLCLYLFAETHCTCDECRWMGRACIRTEVNHDGSGSSHGITWEIYVLVVC